MAILSSAPRTVQSARHLFHRLTDAERERAISVAYAALVAAADKPSKAAAWAILRDLVRARSATVVRAMELARGLRS